ncbi:MAG: FG-GAP-like repeat-containing protein [Gemmataceae bacterium]
MTWLSGWFTSRSSQPSTGFPLRCECLESRLVPAALLDPLRVQQAFQSAWEAASRPGQAALQRHIDLDGDGVPEQLSVVDSGGSSPRQLKLLPLNDRANLASRDLVSLGYDPSNLIVEDFDGDERFDIFLPDTHHQLGMLLLGTPEGGFDAAVDQGSKRDLTLGDISGDGVEDVIFADAAENKISVMLSGGAKEVLADRSNGVFGTMGLHLGDLNGDGILDLLAGNAGNNVLIFPGLGNGAFASEVHQGIGIPTDLGPARFFVTHLFDRVEFDPATGEYRDPYPDLIVACEMTGSIVVFHGTGDWNLEQSQVFHAGMLPTDIVPRDLNGDGLPDLVVTARGSNEVWIIPGQEQGRFDSRSLRVLPVGPAPMKSFVDDFDGDGRLDLVTLASGRNEIDFFSDVDSPFTAYRAISTGGDRPTLGVVGDSNDDGIMDLVVGHDQDGSISYFLGSSSGPLFVESRPSPTGMPSALANGGVTLNGWSIVVASAASLEAVVMTFVAPPVIDLAEPGGETVGPSPEEPPAPLAQLESYSSNGLALIPWLRTPLHDSLPANDSLELETADQPGMGGPGNPLTGKGTPEGASEILPPPSEDEKPTGEPTQASDQQPNLYVLGVEEATSPVLPPEWSPAPLLRLQAMEVPDQAPPEGEAGPDLLPEDHSLSRFDEAATREVEEPVHPTLVSDRSNRWTTDVLLLLAAWSLLWDRPVLRNLKWRPLR